MQLGRNAEHVGMMIGNATDYIETITLVFPSIDEAQHEQCHTTPATTFTFINNFYTSTQLHDFTSSPTVLDLGPLTNINVNNIFIG